MKDAFIVTRDDGSNMEFVPSAEGLHHCSFSLSIKQKKEQENETEKTTVIKTLEYVQRNFTKRELEQAEEAQRLDVIVGRPSQKFFEQMLKGGKLARNTITVQDYRNC